MGREATKAAGNPWYEARKRAAEYDDRLSTAAYTFYAIWDEIRMVSDDLERLAGDARVVDAIYAANDVRKRNGTLKTED